MSYKELVHELYFVASGVKSERYKSLLTRAADAIQELTAEQEQRWIKIKRKQLTPWSYVMDCKLPDNKQEVLVSDGQSIWIDTFNKDPEGLSFRYGGTEIEKLWWQPLPQPPEEVKE